MRIHDYLEYFADTTPDRICADDGERSVTFGEMERWANGVAAALVDLGVSDGDRFGVLARNCLEWVAIYFGAFKAGAVPVPLNFRLHPREWAALLDDCEAEVLLAQAEYIGALDAVRPDLPSRLSTVVTIDRPADNCVFLADRCADRNALRTGQKILPHHDLWQMYTSGTTGRPKGAVVAHAAVDANILQVRSALSVQSGDRILVVMPLFHAAAAVNMLVAIAAGGGVRIMAEFDPAECVRVLDEESIASATFAPAMFQAMLAAIPGLGARRFGALRTICYGGSPIAAGTLRSALETFDCDFLQGYGQTEASAALTMLGPEHHRRAAAGEDHLLRSCGRPVLGTEIALIDSDGEPVAVDEVGEIIARGPQLMRGYWNQPQATEAVLVDGWLHTGDAGWVDAEGFLYVCDRLTDMIVSGAENIYPKEIEEVLLQMPGVADAAVIGVPDDRWGEAVRAVVVARPAATITEDAVIAWCRDHLAGYKAPRAVDFVETLPRNAMGKVLKRLLREPHWAGRKRQVS